jgi:predicted nucleic acid-binding Zn ribbon protein
MISKRDEPQRFGLLLDEVLSEKGYLTVCKEYGLVSKWPLIAGEKIAGASRCEKIEKGILYVKMASAPWRQEAVYSKEKILLKIQKEFGCPTIKDIVFY